MILRDRGRITLYECSQSELTKRIDAWIMTSIDSGRMQKDKGVIVSSWYTFFS